MHAGDETVRSINTSTYTVATCVLSHCFWSASCVLLLLHAVMSFIVNSKYSVCERIEHFSYYFIFISPISYYHFNSLLIIIITLLYYHHTWLFIAFYLLIIISLILYYFFMLLYYSSFIHYMGFATFVWSHTERHCQPNDRSNECAAWVDWTDECAAWVDWTRTLRVSPISFTDKVQTPPPYICITRSIQ